jgi:hypothetical protein
MVPRITLSAPERAQLGTTKNAVPYLDAAGWTAFRERLVAKSAKRNPGFFDPALAAYTPGETEALLDQPAIAAWHDRMRAFRVPADYQGIMLVPCAASKPWRDHPNMHKSKLYQAYNRLIAKMDAGELPRLYLLTVSEPLGIVPQDQWNAFPAYDNPGLFRDDFLRTGMVKTDWTQGEWGQRYRLPFDEAAYTRCIDRLAAVIGTVLQHNPLPVLSFVDDPGMATTHGHMLDVATAHTPTLAERLLRLPKRTTPRVDPTDDLARAINHAIEPLSPRVGGTAVAPPPPTPLPRRGRQGPRSR